MRTESTADVLVAESGAVWADRPTKFIIHATLVEKADRERVSRCAVRAVASLRDETCASIPLQPHISYFGWDIVVRRQTLEIRRQVFLRKARGNVVRPHERFAEPGELLLGK